MMNLQQRLNDAVAKLDVLGTSEAVGLEMVARGIKAQPACASKCVLAEYFTAVVGDEYEYGVAPEAEYSTSRWCCYAYTPYSEERSSVVLPDHVTKLAKEFDEGLWPQLEVGP